MEIITEQEIKRINELYHKSKEGGLTDEELEEQRILRQKYISSVRASLRSNLNSIEIVEADGSVTPLKKKESF